MRFIVPPDCGPSPPSIPSPPSPSSVGVPPSPPSIPSSPSPPPPSSPSEGSVSVGVPSWSPLHPAISTALVTPPVARRKRRRETLSSDIRTAFPVEYG
ncbi:hypothetical protein BRC78_08905 [Halobacteriales archaeon QH_8_68_33]|nr:MAG: hypothetical protein BRC78_08905 [Halobacteriales archaeon QH_8_68_33]